MKDLPPDERPYEKLERMGPEQLSNAELLAIIIRTGNRTETSVSLAQRIISRDEEEKGLRFLYDMSPDQLKEIPGIGRVKALQLQAMMELSKRISTMNGSGRKVVLRTSAEVSLLVMEEMRYLKKEVFKSILLDSKNHVIRKVNISTGSLNSSIVHPREVFSEAVRTPCSAVIFAHNHPSGDPEPSPDDIQTTGRLVNAGNVIGIKVLDHIIIGDGCYFSFKEKGLI